MDDKLNARAKSADPLAASTDVASRQAEKLNREIEKLGLEIDNLRKKNKWEAFLPVIPPLISVVTVLLSVIGLGFAFVQFKSQQDKWLTDQKDERVAKEEERTAQYLKQLRSDVDEISKFTQDKAQTISRVSFLLDDMKVLIDSASTNSVSPEAFWRYERAVSKALVEQIVNDSDFQKNPQHVIFAAKVVRYWPDYQKYLKEEGQLVALPRILSNYAKAMGTFRNKNTKWLDLVSYNAIAKVYNTPKDSDAKLFQDLSNILRGFKEHLDLVSGGPQAKQQVISEFQKALRNNTLAQETLRDDFIAEDGKK